MLITCAALSDHHISVTLTLTQLLQPQLPALKGCSDARPMRRRSSAFPAEVIPTCRELGIGIGIVAYAPLCSRFLTSQIRLRDDLAAVTAQTRHASCRLDLALAGLLHCSVCLCAACCSLQNGRGASLCFELDFLPCCSHAAEGDLRRRYEPNSSYRTGASPRHP